MRRVATFELVDNDLIKENLWKYYLEETVSHYLLMCGMDSNHLQFILGCSLYVLAFAILAVILLKITNHVRTQNEIRAQDFEGGEDGDERPRSDCQKCIRRFCLKFCDGEAAMKSLAWNFFMKFCLYLTLEITISIAMQLTIIDKIDNRTDAWGRALCYFFCVAYSAFLIFVLFFLFCCCSSANERMEKYEALVGALYEGIRYKDNVYNKLVTVIFIFKRIIFVATYFYIETWHLPIF